MRGPTPNRCEDDARDVIAKEDSLRTRLSADAASYHRRRIARSTRVIWLKTQFRPYQRASSCDQDAPSGDQDAPADKTEDPSCDQDDPASNQDGSASNQDAPA
jgi:hypothetical protein